MEYNYKVSTSVSEKQEWSKDEDAFKSHEGICYTDSNGNGYAYDDLMSYMRSPEGTKKLFEELHGRAPEKELKANSWDFWQCKRCGAWHHFHVSMVKKKSRTPCEFCTPLRTNGKIRLVKDPYEDDRTFYNGRYASFRTGLTTITGCNGIGKTTLVQNIVDELKGRGTPYFLFDNLGESGGEKNAFRMLNEALSSRNGAEEFFSGLNMFSLSEGEKIITSLNRFMNGCATAISETSVGYGELWFLFDAVDSGLSADFIEDFKDMLRNLYKDIMQAHPLMQVYILVTSNSYETCHGTSVYSVAKNRYVNIRTYEAFVKETRASREYKVQRDHVFVAKEEIAKRPYTFVCDEDLLQDWPFNHEENETAEAAVMELENFRLVVCPGDYGNELRLYRKSEDGEYTMLSCKDAEIDSYSYAKRLKQEMHEYLCERVYKEEMKKKK